MDLPYISEHSLDKGPITHRCFDTGDPHFSSTNNNKQALIEL